MKTQIQHILKFKLWALSTNHIFLKYPIRYLGKLINRGVEKAWKKRLTKSFRSIKLDNKYIRSPEIPVQVAVFTDEKIHNTEYDGIALLLNHMRVPHHVNNRQSIGNRGIFNLSLVIFTDSYTYESNKHAYEWNNDTAFIIFSSKEKTINANKTSNRVFIKEKAYKFLPPYDGLRSEFSANIINTIRKIVRIPLVTGMPTKSIGLRIDDVKGDNISIYLDDICQHNWNPDLGIFLDDIEKSRKSVKKYLSDLNKKNLVSIGPHSYSNEKFIFYNYPKGRPYSQSEFDSIWNDVLSQFTRYKFNLSPVINAHFHVLSESAASRIVENGVKYFFSELEIGEHKSIPSDKYWPSGDPQNCTGALNNSDGDGVFQLSSGDNILDTLNPKSNYDFLMHSNDFNLNIIRERILYRLKMSLDCGFAAYITTHEYLINNMGFDRIKDLWRLVDLDLQKQLDYRVSKSSLGSIGREFETMRNSMINSVRFNKGVLKVEMKGNVEFNDHLSIFKDNKIFTVSIPSYTDRYNIEVDL